jgi:hypothetical protein
MEGKYDSLLIKTVLIIEMVIRALTVFNLMLKVFSGDCSAMEAMTTTHTLNHR